MRDTSVSFQVFLGVRRRRVSLSVASIFSGDVRLRQLRDCGSVCHRRLRGVTAARGPRRVSSSADLSLSAATCPRALDLARTVTVDHGVPLTRFRWTLLDIFPAALLKKDVNIDAYFDVTLSLHIRRDYFSN